MPVTGDAPLQAQDAAAAALRTKFVQGMALHDQGKLAEAAQFYRDVLQQQPDHFGALHRLGLIAIDVRQFEQAAELIEKATKANPNAAIAHNNLGKVLLDLKRPAQALASLDRTIALKPDLAGAHNNRGLALLDLHRPEDALASFERAIALKPDQAKAHFNRGNVLRDLLRPAEALASFDRAIALAPDYAEAYSNRALTLQDLKRPADALASYERAIALKPDLAGVHFNQSLCLLKLGRFEQGWREYEWRMTGDEAVAARAYRQPRWRGEEDIAGKTVFVWPEQGLGDTIQFCRYVPMLEARGAKVVMSVQQPLHGLLKQIGPTVKIIGRDETPDKFDYHCPLLSLPLAFGTTLATIPPQHLKADENLRTKWAAGLPPKTRPRIGLVWSGKTDHKVLQNRSIDLQRLLPILGEDFDWICLQSEVRESDRAALEQSGRIACFAGELKDFNDTAALLDLTDLVVTIDTGVAHLAGAMGKPVWIMLLYNADWRWLLDRDDSPWYPSARLFRQQRIGDWTGVIDRVNDQLRLMRRNA